jgi:hypothetical protein
MMNAAASLFQQFTLSSQSETTIAEGRFGQLIQNGHTFGHDVWIASGGLQEDAKPTEDAVSNCFN